MIEQLEARLYWIVDGILQTWQLQWNGIVRY